MCVCVCVCVLDVCIAHFFAALLLVDYLSQQAADLFLLSERVLHLASQLLRQVAHLPIHRGWSEGEGEGERRREKEIIITVHIITITSPYNPIMAMAL